MITNILFVVGLALLAALFAKVVDMTRKRDTRMLADKMSFKETLDLTELPIVTFRNNDKKFNFLLDTGATNSVINKSALADMVSNPTEKKDTIYGSDGNREEVDIVSIGISYKDNTFDEEFYAKDLDAAFGNLKVSHGVNLHGILGNSFFQRYRYVIDFDKLVAYSAM